MSQASESAIVAIIDNVPSRESAIRSRFSSVAGVQLTTLGTRKPNILYLRTGLSTKQEFTGEVLLALVHLRNLPLKIALKAVLVIYYGGNEPHDKDFEREELYKGISAHESARIWRSVNSEEDIPTLDEAQQLLDYALVLKVGKKGMPKPALISPPIPCDLLPALAILCQGYLAVHSDMENEDEHIKTALVRMRWKDLMSSSLPDRTHIRSDVTSDAAKKEVCNVGWWRRVFYADARAPDWMAFRGEIQKEWQRNGQAKMSQDVSDLLSQLQRGRIESPAIVARAYTELADWLDDLTKL